MFPADDQPRSPDTRKRTLLRLAEVIVLLSSLFLIRACLTESPRSSGEPSQEEAPSAIVQVKMTEPQPIGPLFGPPTPQRMWKHTEDPKVYMPTGSGRVISASYGSVRTRSSGRASFHEGVDVAPITWKNGRAQDPIFAVGDGRVVYINRVGGNSSYGAYVVISHQSSVGEFYTLYAHLASVPKELSEGDAVERGDTIGIMGHSSTLGIPRIRSHLHFEICMMLNPHFKRWYRTQKLPAIHGKYHGHNLAGLNPHLLLSRLHDRENVPFSLAEALEETRTAWTLLVRTRRKPEYFTQYPARWNGGGLDSGAMILEVSESGVILSGRAATAEEIDEAGSQKTKVLQVDTEVLGRNGVRHVQQRSGEWRLASNGERWLEILMYHP